MIKDIIRLLNERINKGNDFSLLATNEVETITAPDGNGGTLRLPAFYDREYKYLLPTDRELGIVFYRVLSDTQTIRPHIRSVQIRVVGWQNTRFVDIQMMARRMGRNYDGTGKVSRMVATVTNVSENAGSEWRGFDLSERETQYLMAPYRSFFMDLTLQVVLNPCTVASEIYLNC